MKKKTYIIAEIGINHCGNIKIAEKLINIAKKSGANAVKFQSYKTEKLVNLNSKLMPYQQKNIKKNISQYDMLKKCELNEQDHLKLKKYCNKKKIDFISTPYDIESAKLLIKLNCKIIKIASTDVTNIQLIRYLLSKKKKLIISTGATDIKDINLLIKLIKKKYSTKNISLLHCISYYPAPLESLNLTAIQTLNKKFKLDVGFSDHSIDLKSGAFAVMLGAKIIEKHITLNKNLFGPDHKASLTPNELKIYVDNIRNAESSLGDGLKKVEKIEKKTKKNMQKSLITNKNLKKGVKIKYNQISSMRPAAGINPLFIDYVVNRKIKKNKKEGDILFWSDFK